MKKIGIAVVLLICLSVGSRIYTDFLNNSVNVMHSEISKAYNCVDYAYNDVPNKLDSVNGCLDNNEIILCIFTDQKLINDIKDELIIAKELYTQHDKNGLKLSLIRIYEKIGLLKDTEEFNLKKIL